MNPFWGDAPWGWGVPSRCVSVSRSGADAVGRYHGVAGGPAAFLSEQIPSPDYKILAFTHLAT